MTGTIGGLGGWIPCGVYLMHGAAHIRRVFADKLSVDRFADHAASIFETAQTAMQSGHAPGDVTILVGPEGGIRVINDSDWPLDALIAQHGAASIYRVRQQKGTVRLEGRSGTRTCVFEADSVTTATRPLLANEPRYEVVPATAPTRALPPAETWQPLPEESD